MAKINLFALGGQDEKFKRLFIIEINSKIFIMDSGIYEPLNNDFGIKNYIPNMEYLFSNRDKIQAIFLSSANMMNIGSILNILKIKNDIPVYGSKSTIESLDVFFKNEKINKNIVSENETKNISGISVTPIKLPSIIPGTFGYKFKTEDGNILYLTDYIFDSIKEFNISPFDNFIKLLNEKNLLLISDSSLASEKTSISSKMRLESLISKFLIKENRFVITVYEDEILNISEIIKLSKINKRKIFFESKTLFDLVKIFQSNDEIEDFPIRMFSEYKDSDNKNSVIILSGTRNKLYKKVELIIDENNKNHFSFDKNDIVYFSALPQSGNEHVFADVTNKASRINIKFHVPEKDVKKIFGTTEFDLRNILTIIKPKFFMPISSYFTQLNAAKEIAINLNINKKNVLISDNGEIFTIKNGFSEGMTFKIKEIESKITDSLDGDSLNNELILERKSIGKDGIVTISFLLETKKNNLVSEIDIQMKGLVISKDQDETINKIKELIFDLFKSDSEKKDSIKKSLPFLRKEIGKIFRQSINKVPTLLINVFEI